MSGFHVSGFDGSSSSAVFTSAVFKITSSSVASFDTVTAKDTVSDAPADRVGITKDTYALSPMVTRVPPEPST